MKRIVYTRFSDGGVSVCTPSEEAVRFMGCGGFWGEKPRGWYEQQIERAVADGRKPDAARRFVRAMVLGGCTTAEAYEIIRDRDCGHLGFNIELHDDSELPANRWFRNAWSRSANGGPIVISLEKARPIQWQKVCEAVAAENKRREDSYELAMPLDMDWGRVRTEIARARDIETLRAIWPAGVEP